MPTETPKKKKSESNQDYLLRCTSKLIDGGEDRRTAFSRCAANFGTEFNPDSALFCSPVELSADGNGGDDPRTFLISAKTGDPIDRWYGKLVIDIKGMRLEPKIPVLRQHSYDRVVGSGQAFKDDDHLHIEGEFSQVTKDAEEVLNLADEGFPWQASIGVWAEEVFFVEAGSKVTVNGQEIQGPVDVWSKSYVREVSFVTLGADSRTAAIALSNDIGGGNPSENNTQLQGDKIMPLTLEDIQTENPELLESIREEARAEGVQAGIDQERGRTVEILEAGADPDATLTAIKDGVPAGDAYKSFFMAEKDKRDKGLAQLKEQATETQGQDGSGDGSGDGKEKDFMTIAKEIKERDQVSMSVAMKTAVRENPEAHRQFLADNRKVSEDGR